MLNNIAVLAVGGSSSAVDRPGGAARPAASARPDGARSRPPGACPRSSAACRLRTSASSLLSVTCGLVQFVLTRTTFGFEVRTVGTNPQRRHATPGWASTARSCSSWRCRARWPGCAGAGEVSGTSGPPQPRGVRRHRLRLDRHRAARDANPFAIVLTATLWGSMLSGAGLMQREAGLSIDAVRIFQALVLLLVAADVVVRTIFRVRRRLRPAPLETAQLAQRMGGGAVTRRPSFPAEPSPDPAAAVRRRRGSTCSATSPRTWRAQPRTARLRAAAGSGPLQASAPATVVTAVGLVFVATAVAPPSSGARPRLARTLLGAPRCSASRWCSPWPLALSDSPAPT